MTVNRIIHVDDDEGSGDVTEPVTLAQLKKYLRVGGFTDESGEHEFSYDDDLMTDMITEGRMWVEKFTGQYLVPRELTVVLLNQAGGQRLPGPVRTGVTLADKDGETIETDDYTIIGSDIVETCFCDRVTATYGAGYDTAPEWAVNAILAYCAFAYENMGDDGELPGSPVRAAAIARPHRKLPLWG